MKKYEEPVVEVETFEVEDIITESSNEEEMAMTPPCL